MTFRIFDAARVGARREAAAELLALAAKYFNAEDDISTTLRKIETLARYLFEADPLDRRPALGEKRAAAIYVGHAWGVAQACHGKVKR